MLKWSWITDWGVYYFSKMQNYKIKTRSSKMMRKSERLAWFIVGFQFFIILINRQPWSPKSSMRGSSIESSSTRVAAAAVTTSNDQLVMNDLPQSHYDIMKQNNPSKPFYDSAVIHPQSAGLVSRQWHSNGFPSINPKLQKGSCWCGGDEWYV